MNIRPKRPKWCKNRKRSLLNRRVKLKRKLKWYLRKSCLRSRMLRRGLMPRLDRFNWLKLDRRRRLKNKQRWKKRPERKLKSLRDRRELPRKNNLPWRKRQARPGHGGDSVPDNQHDWLGDPLTILLSFDIFINTMTRGTFTINFVAE